jgi:hypothetical protein
MTPLLKFMLEDEVAVEFHNHILELPDLNLCQDVG